jgi:hypothetical protein
MTGYTRQDISNNISNGSVIDADDLDLEFNAVESAFNASTGHKHDGTSAEGAPITVVGPAQDVVTTSSQMAPKADNTYDLGSATNKWKDLYINSINLGGTALTVTANEINTLDGITATVTELNILEGVTATTAEINLLDGVTATTTELNYVGGATSSIQTQLNSKVSGAIATPAEIQSLSGSNKLPTTSGIATSAALETPSGASNWAPDWSAFISATWVLTGNRTLSAPTNVIPGTTRVIKVSSDSATTRTVSYAPEYKGSSIPANVTNSAVALLTLYAVSATEVVVSGLEYGV